ncbi:MAG: helix-turn-helix transcriptional regulator [Lachnospiraceae bacterium]|nr:helix-turn-helix transcriptional regulator [Lachnospiraceae bacterium]
MSDFKDILKYYRKLNNLSQREFALRLGISPSAISMYEAGQREPDFKTEEKIADFFNIDLNTLRGRSQLLNTSNSTSHDLQSMFTLKLNELVLQSEKTQKEIADDINVSPQTFNTWCQGIAFPRKDKLQLLFDYFNFGYSDLAEPLKEPDSYTIAIARTIYENPDLLALFELAKDASPEALQLLQDVLSVLNRKGRGNVD